MQVKLPKRHLDFPDYPIRYETFGGPYSGDRVFITSSGRFRDTN